jgi:primase-polymerase (primpol)-like protein
VEKPNYLKPIKENTPDQLIEYDHWVLWRAEYIGERWSKIPYNAKTGRKAKSNDPRTWADFHTVYLRQKHDNAGNFDGIGFVVSNDDPFTAIDLDKCRNPQTGELESWAEEIIKKVDSYTEVSPSGTGIRIFTIAGLPVDGKNSGGIEIYKNKKYLTVTGHKI